MNRPRVRKVLNRFHNATVFMWTRMNKFYKRIFFVRRLIIKYSTHFRFQGSIWTVPTIRPIPYLIGHKSFRSMTKVSFPRSLSLISCDLHFLFELSIGLLIKVHRSLQRSSQPVSLVLTHSVYASSSWRPHYSWECPSCTGCDGGADFRRLHLLRPRWSNCYGVDTAIGPPTDGIDCRTGSALRDLRHFQLCCTTGTGHRHS